MKRNGFTLVEVLIAVVVGLIIMAAVYGTMTLAQRTSANLGRKIVTQQDTRAVLDFMAMEIRMASYNPNNRAATWSTSSLACLVLPNPPDANKGIRIATANTLAVAMDLGPLGPPRVYGTIGDADNEYIVYSYDGANTVTRNVSCGGNQAILGGAAPDSNVRNAIAGIPLFQYFDRNDQPLAAPVNIPAIRRILITIVAETAERDLNTNLPRRMIYSTSVIVRNHALSP
jgi:type IV pilus assembly protein PilW